MPTYEYRCKDCDHEFDAQQSFTDDALTVCPACGGALRKVFGSVGITFKGSGFYKTDSRAVASKGDGNEKAGEKSPEKVGATKDGSSGSESSSKSSAGSNGKDSASSNGDASKSGKSGKEKTPAAGSKGSTKSGSGS